MDLTTFNNNSQSSCYSETADSPLLDNSSLLQPQEQQQQQPQQIQPQQSIKTTILNDIPIATLTVDDTDMLCLAQISSTILEKFSYNEIHNRRVALSISTKPCTANQMELLRCAGAVPPSSRRCGLITRHEAERLVRSFTEGTRPPNLPPGFAFDVCHKCGWGCYGKFFVEKYTSSRAKCIECKSCKEVLAPNKFIFHSHRPEDTTHLEHHFRPADAANFNSWRRHIFLDDCDDDNETGIVEAWEDVKALFNGGNRQNVNVLTMTTLVSSSVNNQREKKRATPPPVKKESSMPVKRIKSDVPNALKPTKNHSPACSTVDNMFSEAPQQPQPSMMSTLLPNIALEILQREQFLAAAAAAAPQPPPLLGQPNLLLANALVRSLLLQQQQQPLNQAAVESVVNLATADRRSADPTSNNNSSVTTQHQLFSIKNLVGLEED